MSRPEIVCVTPVKDEAGILESFLVATGLWADRIVIGDHGSSDDTREIASAFDNVHLFDLPTRAFDEGLRRQALLAEARSLAAGAQVLISLDADEALSAGMLEEEAWAPVLGAQPGTVVQMRHANLAPDRKRAWQPPYMLDVGFVDDGSPYNPDVPIHTQRVPDGSDELVLDGQFVLHRQYLDWKGMRAKQRFYQVWEAVNHQHGPLDVWRIYHHMDAVPAAEWMPVDRSWLVPYENAGVDLMDVPWSNADRWDDAVLDLMVTHGVECLRRLDLWDVDWPARCLQLGRSVPSGAESDPRTRFERAAHSWLAKTQGKVPKPRPVWWGERLLRRAGW